MDQPIFPEAKKLQQQFNYPDIVTEHLSGIINAIKPFTCSLLLTGSTARGELTCINIDGITRVMSDYEFVLVPVNPFEKNKMQILDAIKELEITYLKNHPLCHIDISFMNNEGIKSLPKTLQTHENRINGISMLGEDLRNHMPVVNLNNLDYKELNEIILWRLLALLLHAPYSLKVENPSDQIINYSYRYLIYRNVLDLTTWILPRNGILLPSFSERILYLKKCSSKLSFVKKYPDKFLSFLYEAMEVKNGALPERKIEDLHSEALTFFEVAIGEMFDESVFSINTSLVDVVSRGNNKTFRDWNWKRKAWELMLALNGYPSGLNLWKRIVWITQPKYGRIIGAMLEMHRALNNQFIGQPAGQHTSKSKKLIEDLAGTITTIESQQKETEWLTLREALVVFLLHYFRFMMAKKEYYLKLIGSSPNILK